MLCYNFHDGLEGGYGNTPRASVAHKTKNSTAYEQTKRKRHFTTRQAGPWPSNFCIRKGKTIQQRNCKKTAQAHNYGCCARQTGTGRQAGKQPQGTGQAPNAQAMWGRLFTVYSFYGRKSA